MAHSTEKESIGQIIKLLLSQAGRSGRLTSSDIHEIYPETRTHNQQYHRILGLLASQGIEVLNDEVEVDAIIERLGRIEDARLGGGGLPNNDMVSLYLQEMSITPLLTLEEERSLAARLERAEQARLELALLNGRKAEIRQELEIQVQDGHLAREALIKANTRLVVSIARRYLGHGVPFLDLIQEGNLGLIKAVERFDYRRGFRFSTYATWWIRQGIIRAIADQGRTIRVPVHLIDRLRQIYKATQLLEQKLGRLPTSEELAASLQLKCSKLSWILLVSQSTVSLETPVGDEEEGELGMYVEDDKTPSPVQLVYEKMLREQVDQVLSTLTPREARVIRLRFGLGQDRAYTLEEVGQKFGLTRERIRQIEGNALRRLRQPSRARLLRETS